MGRVCHGSHDLARSQDPRSLTRVFLRLLGAHEQPARPGELRLTMPAVARAHAALLAPLAVNLGLIPDRWYAARDLTPFVALTTRVDIDTMEVVVDPPLGSGEDPVRVRLAGCWLASYNSSRELTPGRAVAYLMGSVCDVTPANAPVALRQVADLVAHVPPVESPWLMRDVMAGLEIELSERGGA
jgi:hypothetical protein